MCHLFCCSFYIALGISYLIIKAEPDGTFTGYTIVYIGLYFAIPIFYFMMLIIASDNTELILALSGITLNPQWVIPVFSPTAHGGDRFHRGVRVQPDYPIEEEVKRKARELIEQHSRRYTGDEEPLQECIICLNEFTETDEITDMCISPNGEGTGHIFHQECLETHFVTSYERHLHGAGVRNALFNFQCPLCKRALGEVG